MSEMNIRISTTAINFFETDLTNVDITGVDLSNASISMVDLSQVDLRGVALNIDQVRQIAHNSNINLEGGLNLPNVDLSFVNLIKADLTKAIITKIANINLLFC